MTTPAVRTELAEMPVIAGVTSPAPARGRGRNLPGPMAAVAVDLRVRSLQDEARFQTVIEAPQIPAVWIVATLAAASKARSVNVVGRVATRADDLRILESRSGVTLLARNDGVQAEQWQARQVVLEEDVVAPVEFPVANAAISSLLSAMDVIIHMTTPATGIDLGIFGNSDMALVAPCIPMSTA